jgi:hypothetical protein
MNEHIIVISSEFSECPAGRNKKDGPRSGEHFREDYLVPKLRKAESAGVKLVIDLDNTEGIGSSFLDEAFGGLVREHGFTPDELKKKLEFKGKETMFELYKKQIIMSIEGE